jgi:hypothetical protein
MTRPATLAAAAYLALTLAITWPLATRLVSGVTGDWTASLPGVWAMATASQKLTGLLTGPGAALATFWDADIFYPAPKALLYSEPLIGPAVLTLPIWWMTGNGLLIFNLTAIACQALMGLGTFLLTRAFAGGVAGSFVTGLFAVFALTEALSAGPRLEILSLCWLPFALLAWHRYVERGTWAALALTIACAWLLNASSTGYLWVCAPVLIAFAVLDLAAQPQRRAIDRWIGLAIAVPAVALLSAPFILPLAELRRQGLELSSAMGSGGIGAVSAGSLGFLTADLIVGVAALFGLVFAFRRHPTGTRSYVWLVLALIATTIIGYVVLSVRNDVSALEIQTLPHALAAFGWLVTLLAGVGLTAIETRRAGPSIVAGAGLLFLVLTWLPTLSTNVDVSSASAGNPLIQPPPAYLEPSPNAPPIYRAVESLPSDAVLVEFPFGIKTYELRYMFFSTIHGRRLMNGHGERLPPTYLARERVLTDPLLDPEQSVRALGGATHVIVHGRAWSDDTGVRIARWLESIGGQAVPTSGDALLYQMVAPERFASR